MPFRLITDGAAIELLLRGPSGPTSRFLIGRAEVYKQAVIREMPRKTGCLQDSLVKRFELSDTGMLAVRLVSDTTPCSPTRTAYSLFVHEGTAPHDIPNAFGWGPTFGIGGRFDGKFHPGTKPCPFFTRALPALKA